jgi:superfamily I DNA and RNA helicase
MASSSFFLQVEKSEINSNLIERLDKFSIESRKQLYIIDKPLGDNKYMYSCDRAIVLLSPEHKITFINLGAPNTEFVNYSEDFLEDLGSISDKYRYKDKIGRPRKWRDELVHLADKDDTADLKGFFETIELADPRQKKLSELLISLLTGSINDASKVNDDVPENFLDKVKQKILLFDGEQTRFIYHKPSKHTIRIQGLSGTGKTELLLHKLKEIYLSEEQQDSKIMFTCHNKILASSLRKRIPDFFDFMRVEQQILWNERLWCVNAWGSQSDKNSGAYSYVCSFYSIPFMRYSRYVSFDTVCSQALTYIVENNIIEKKGHAFDYILLDESQDFPESFLKLCKLVTKTNLYIAGDIFQSIFDDDIVSEIEPDYLLSKCYRTDPRTLMFAHALGMGLFETPKLQWLDDKEWIACGYQPSKEGEQYILEREPLRRFSDIIDEEHSSVEIVKTSARLNEVSESKIIEVIKEIQHQYPSVTVDDIGIVFIDNHDYAYNTADNLVYSIKNNFGWEVNKAYETRAKIKNTLFVSNKNHVKGLEFPFVICVTKKINDNPSYRNALYMMLTRSFLTSYLLINEESNHGLLELLEIELHKINGSGRLVVNRPTKEEIKQIKTKIKYTEVTKSFYDSVYDVFDELDVDVSLRSQFYKIIQLTMKDDSFDRNTVLSIIEFNLNISSGGYQ